MDCEQALALWQAHMDRELQPEDRPRLEMHLRECARCRASTEAHRLQDADLRRVFAQRRRASAAVADRVIAQLPAKPSRAQWRIPWMAVVLSAAAGFLVAVLLFRPWSKTPELVPGDRQELAVEQKDKTPAPKPETVLLVLATDSNQACEILLPGEAAWQALKMGGEIAFGTRVRTRPQVLCEFRTHDGSQVRVNGGTELVFSEHRRIELDKGQILARIAEAASPFRVSIPEATLTALGTEFDLLCKPVETVLTVLDGAAKVEGKAQWRTIQTGEQATIVDGLVVRKRLLRQYDQIASWTNELLRLKGPTDPESAKRIRLMLDDALALQGSIKGEFPEEQIRGLGPHAVVALTRYLQSERSKPPQERNKRHRAARILADMAEPWSVADLIELLGDTDSTVRFYAAVALKRLTKETLGLEPDKWRDRSGSELKDAREAWRKWWLKNKVRYPDASQIADWRIPK